VVGASGIALWGHYSPLFIFVLEVASSRPIPASRARITACALSATCSLSRMLETWFLTVFKLARERISSSRSVSSGKARCGAAGLGAEK
jgi:hypothetical protein